MTIPKFALNEIVFAKLKGWPAWPAKVEFFENIHSTKKVKYNVYFYGTNQIAQCKEDDLFPYRQYRNKFGKSKKAKGLMKAIIQADTELKRHVGSIAPTNKQFSYLKHLDYLKAEVKLLKIDQQIKNSLNLGRPKPNLGTCLNLLDEYSATTITPLMFKKNPQLIDTIVKLQVYSGSVNFENVASDESKINLIRKKARDIYYRIQSIFIIPKGKAFIELFTEELNEFHKCVKNMSENDLLQLSRDPTVTE